MSLEGSLEEEDRICQLIIRVSRNHNGLWLKRHGRDMVQAHLQQQLSAVGKWASPEAEVVGGGSLRVEAGHGREEVGKQRKQPDGSTEHPVQRF